MDDHKTSSLSSQSIEEEPPNFNRLHRTSRNNIISQRFNSYGIPLKPSGKSTVVIAIQENRKREKHDLSYLNDRFASYIERVRFLEAQNKKLQLEIDQFREKWALQINKIKEMYEIEIREARFIIDDTKKDRAIADLRAKRIEEEILKLKDRYESLLVGRGSDRQRIELLQRQISDNEADINLFHRRLIDLEDEHRRYHTKSQELILDIQRITKELDNETITRIQLENQKEKLEEEINFLREIHSQEIEEIKQTSLINTRLDPTDFFKHELSNAVRNIREEYEQRNYHQRNELASEYQWKATQALQEIQSHQSIENSDNIREQEEFKKLQRLITDSRNDIATMRQRNDELKERIRELENFIHIERDDNKQASDEYDRQIKDVRAHLENLDRDYDKLISTKSSLNSEITSYRKLLEGDEKREGLRQTVTNIKAPANFYADQSTTYSYLRSYQKTSTSQGFDNNHSMLTSYVPFQSMSSTRIEPTIFERVYRGDRRRRPMTISLNVQWIPAADRSSTYQWNESDRNNRKLKRRTLFETGTMREQQSRQAVTPPSSDYTDAYLSAFAPKPIPTKHIYQLTTPLFTNVTPIPFEPTRTHLSTDNSIVTSKTRLNNINHTQTSHAFDTIVPSFPSSSSTYSSSFIPDISTKDESFSSAQSSLPDAYRSELPFENILKPLPVSSIQSYPSSTTTATSSLPSLTISTYKPSVSFQSAPLSSSNDIDDSSTSQQKVLPSLDTETQIKRPETLLFQHDEDIRSSSIEKPSPILTPLLESPMTHIQSKMEAEHPLTEDLSIASSRPIEIFENTITKYDSLISQISDILASVSPLNPTMNSISPSKSVLDYDFSSNGSPILQPKRIEPQLSQQSTTSVRNTYIQRIKAGDLIRDDSYDKLITAIADLDNEMTPPPDTRMPSLTEETNTSSFDEHQTPSLLNETKERTEILLRDEQQLLSVGEREKDEHLISSISPSDISTNEIPLSNETKLEQETVVDVQSKNETQVDGNEFIQSQTCLLSNARSDEAITQEPIVFHGEVPSNKNDKKHVMWGETIIHIGDDESSSYQSLTEESHSSETAKAIATEQRLTSDESTTVVKQDMNTSISNEKIVSDEPNTPPDFIDDEQVISEVSITLPISSTSYPKDQTTTDEQENQEEIIEQQIKSSRSSETSSSFSDSVDPETTPSDLDESRTSQDEQVTSSRNSPNSQFVPAIDSSVTDTFTFDERSNTISDIINEENSTEQVEETEFNKTKTTTQLIDNTENETNTSANDSLAISLLPIVVSPIDTLADLISTRYISSDVYHGYLGEHTQFTENLSDNETVNIEVSRLTSLQPMIATPITPLLETIQSVVSSMQSITAMYPLINETQVIDHNQNETKLATAVLADSTEEIHVHETQIEENKQTLYTSEDSKIVLESLPNTFNEVPNLQADQQKVLSTLNEGQVEPAAEEFISTEDVKDLTTREPTLSNNDIDLSDEKLIDHPTNEIEPIISPSFDFILENISDTILTPTEATQNAVSADVATLINEDKEQITSNIDTTIVEQIENVMVESLSSKVPILLSAKDEMTENITMQHGEQMSTETVIPSEDTDTTSIQKINNLKSESSEIEINPVNEKLADLKMVDDTTIGPTLIVQDDKQVLTTNTVPSEQIDTVDKDEVPQVEFASIETTDATNSKQNIDEIKTSVDDTPSLFGTINDKIESVISSLPTEENQPLIEQNFGPTNHQTDAENITSTAIIRDRFSSYQENEQILTSEKPEFHSDYSIEDDIKDFDDADITQTTVHSSIHPTDTPLISIMPELPTTFETDELPSDINKDYEIILNTIQKLINDIIQTVTLRNSIPASDNDLTQSIGDFESDLTSIKTEIENTLSKASIDLSESSPTNTEPNSLELMHALRGHSIALPNSSEQIFHPSDKSSSSTASSQITNSDRYVSYAIHTMHESSQDLLPAIPIAADMPIYKNIEEKTLLEPMVILNQSTIKEDDSTECDASDELISYSDDILLRKLHRRNNLDSSSTDDDVDEEFEEHDLTDIHRMINKLTQPSDDLSTNEDAYQLYDLATTPSSNNSSTSSSKQQPDDVYIIPGYPGLWRPPADNGTANLPKDYDADDQRKTVTKTRTIVPLSDSVRRPLTFQHHRDQTTNLTQSEILTSGVPLRPDTIDIFNRPLNEFSFDISESDSYQTCSSSIQKQSKLNKVNKSEDQRQSSPDESIFLIRERERGVSLPVTVNIDCDDIVFRLSTSTPNEAKLWTKIQSNFSSPSPHSQPALPAKTDPNSQASSPSLDNYEDDQQKLSSWLNTINTVTTTTEGSDGSLESRITFLKSAKGPISISECHVEGHYVIIDNTSRSKNIDLTNWIIRQEKDHENKIIFTFPTNCLLKPNHSLKIWSKANEPEQTNDDLIAISVSSWHIGPNIVTTLINPDGKDCAMLTKKTILS